MSIPKPDTAFIRKIRPFFKILESYFRYEARGLGNIPEERALVVMNHGVIPFHGFLLAKKLIDRGTYPRSLGATFLFKIPGLREFFSKGGALKASPDNARRLLKAGHIVILAPGGIYEALIAKRGLRRIPWERRKGFVRVAVEQNAPIIPTYGQGIHSVYYNSYLFLKPRIKLLEKTRFSLPFFFGFGLLPLPVKIVHRIGKAIPVTRKKKETKQEQIDRIHREVLRSMARLAKERN